MGNSDHGTRYSYTASRALQETQSGGNSEAEGSLSRYRMIEGRGVEGQNDRKIE
jgi:hypothetical protein